MKTNRLVAPFCLLALLLLQFSNGFSQTILEVSYYKPLEAAGGGYTEAKAAYVLQCTPRHSLFVFIPGDAVTSMEELSWDRYEMNTWMGEEEHWIYKDVIRNELTEYVISMQDNHYLVNDTVHPMSWDITSETKYIEGLQVKKAHCEHRGRSYTVWFAPNIPINNGPWKLGGLPGLILEAYDDEKEVVFLFKSLKQITDAGVAIQKPGTRGQKIGLRDYLEENEKEMNDFMEFMEAKMKGMGADVDIEFDTKYTSWEYLK